MKLPVEVVTASYVVTDYGALYITFIALKYTATVRNALTTNEGSISV
jgi:hypothetical protein